MSLSAITKGTILNLSSNTDVYERGERYFRDGKILSMQQQTDPQGRSVVRCTVEGNYKNYTVTLTVEKAGTLHYTCSCESHSIWRGACKHVVASLFAYMEGGTPLDTMRRHGSTVADALSQLIFEGIDTELALPAEQLDEPVKLVPTLHLEPKGIFFTLTIGMGRLYAVRNVEHFVESCRRGEVISYGASAAFAHKRAVFDEAGRRLLDFVIDEQMLLAEIGKPLRFTAARKLGMVARAVTLNERNIDRFFDLYAGEVLKGEGDFRPEVKLGTGRPPLALYITHRADGTLLKAEYPAFRVLKGRNFFYLLLTVGILRMAQADGALIIRLLQLIKDAPQQEIFFDGAQQQQFLSVILPKLQMLGLVKETTGQPPATQTAPLHARIYLEDDDPYVQANIEYRYDGKKVTDESADMPRDMVAEYTLRRMLAACGFKENKYSFTLKDDEAIYALLRNTKGALDLLRQHAEVFISDSLAKKTPRRTAKTQLGVRMRGDLLDVTVQDADYSLAELTEALDSYRTRKKFFRMHDGRFMDLRDESVIAPLHLLDSLHVNPRKIEGDFFVVPTYRALHVHSLVGAGGFGEATLDAAVGKLIADFSNGEKVAFRVPRGLNKILRAYQKTGYIWLKTLAHYGFGGILADDMGLGKTLQVIALLESERGKVKHPALVVVPTSLLYNWENELNRFAPKLRVMVISGTAQQRKELIGVKHIDVFITTYNTLSRDAQLHDTQTYSYVIADEAQYIKNPGTQAAKSIKALNGLKRFALTGTPIENNLTELWSIFDFIMPGYLHSQSAFSKQYETPIVRDGDDEQAAALRAQIAPFVLRRLKKNVLAELPEKTETTLTADMLPEQKRAYQAYLMEAIGALDDIIARDAFANNRISILAKLMRLRQVCCHPGLFIENYEGGSGKFELALETVQIALESGHRVLLFSQFTGMLGRFRKAFDADKVTSYFYLDGGTTASERIDMSTRFNAGQRDVFLISLKAGGTGLNLIGADVVIHYDPWWNPSVMDQASDRAHRLGQQKAVQVINIVAKDSIEEKIMALQEKKRGLIDNVITEGGSFINALTAEEVRALFVN